MEHSSEILPKHIGIIMDGNGRWANKRGLPRHAGHKEGAKTLQKIIKYADKIGIKHLTVYAFSTENWKRPQEEIDMLMNLLRAYLVDLEKRKNEEGFCIKILGDMTPFDDDIKEKVKKLVEGTANKTGLIVNIAFNYGGRAEIVTGVKEIIKKIIVGELSQDDITEELISANLYTSGQPDPDLIIRPSGEHRTSNFLLWQSAYSEYVIMNVLWPDFSEKDLDEALLEYAKRNRRFGGL